MASISLEGTIKKKNRGALQRIRKLLLVIQKSETVAANNQRATLQDAIVTKQASGILPSEVACVSGIDNSRAAAVERAVTSRHSCEHHLEWMDPLLWSTLPTELIELVFARLSIAKIIDLCVLSMEWSTMSKSSNFRKVFSERHPKLFGLVGRGKAGGKLREVVYDVRCNVLTSRGLGGIGKACFTRPFSFVSPGQTFNGFRRVNDPNAYAIPLKESDGGLACFVPQRKLLTVPILVGNPIADEWKALPCIPLVNKKTNKDPTRVQLVMEEDTKCYRVIVVFYHFTSKEYAAYCFDSRTGVWKCEESSLSYEDGCSRLLMTSVVGDQCDFDRITKMLYDLVYCSSVKGADARRSAMVKDRLFVLHHKGRSD